MKQLNIQADQGDLHFRRVDALPEGLTEVKPQGNEHIVAHSETGHHHVLPAKGVALFSVNGNPFVMYAKIDEEVHLTHKRSYKTHETVAFLPGLYAFHKQRQQTPEGMMRVVD